MGSLSDVKPAMKVRFDKFEEDQLLGGVLKRLTLNNTIQDPSKLNTCLTYSRGGTAGAPVPVRQGGGERERHGNLRAHRCDQVGLPEAEFLHIDGNHYEGTLSDFRDGWYGTMEKKTNEEEEDWSDIEALSAALSRRTRIGMRWENGWTWMLF